MRRSLLLPLLFGALLAAASPAWSEGIPRPVTGGVSIPGLVGTVGNEETLAYLQGLATAPNLPSLPRIYFSSGGVSAGEDDKLAVGNDTTGDGSRQRPYRSLGRALPLIQAGGVTLIWDCDVWDQPSGGAIGTGTGDDESPTFPLTNTQFLIDTNFGDWQRCNDPQQACVVWKSIDPSCRPHFDENMIDAFGWALNGNEGFFEFGIGTDKGWFHFENLAWTGPWPPDPNVLNADWFETEDEVAGAFNHVSWLNVDWNMASHGLINDNEIFAGHNYAADTREGEGDIWIAINGKSFWADQGLTAEAIPYAAGGAAAILLIGGEVISEIVEVDTGTEYYSIRLNTRNGQVGSFVYGFAYNHKVVFDPANSGLQFGFTLLTHEEAGQGGRLFVANTSVQGAVGAPLGSGFYDGNSPFQGQVGNGRKDQTIIGFRNSSWNNASLMGIGNQAKDPLTEFTWEEICTWHHDGPDGTASLINHSNNTDMTGVVLRFRDVHVNDNATVAQLDGTTYATGVLFCGAPEGIGTPCDVIDLGPAPVDTDAQGEAGGITTSSALVAACTERVFEQFPSWVYIPEYFFAPGLTMTGLALDGVGKSIGR